MSHDTSSSIDTSIGDLRIRRVAGHIGGEVQDLEARAASCHADMIEQLNAALVKHKVLFFRGQTHLDDAEHQAFGARFGRTVAHPTVPAPQGTQAVRTRRLQGRRPRRFVAHRRDLRRCLPEDLDPARRDHSGLRRRHRLGQHRRRLRAPARRSSSTWPTGCGPCTATTTTTAPTARMVEEERLRHHRKVFVSAVYEAEHPVVHVHPGDRRARAAAGPLRQEARRACRAPNRRASSSCCRTA